MKKQTTNRGLVFQQSMGIHYISNKGLISNMYKELPELNSKNQLDNW